VSFFWLNYRYPEGQFAGAVVIEATALIIARMQASVFGLDEGLHFAGGRAIDDASADQIPESMVDRLLDHSDLRRLHRLFLTKKLSPQSVKIRRRRKLQRKEVQRPTAAPRVDKR
jgi:hypothetical protein